MRTAAPSLSLTAGQLWLHTHTHLAAALFPQCPKRLFSPLNYRLIIMVSLQVIILDRTVTRTSHCVMYFFSIDL